MIYLVVGGVVVFLSGLVWQSMRTRKIFLDIHEERRQTCQEMRGGMRALRVVVHKAVIQHGR